MQQPAKQTALRFVVILGIVNLFADMTYEGARGSVGAFLQHLGASGTAVGLVAGGGEFAGYAIRSVSGMIADRTGLYWIEVWGGYLINMLCVPALALAGNWPAAAGLAVGERIGRGMRKPVMSMFIARAGLEIGHGRAFAVNELLDQIGATGGPLIVAFAIARGGFHFGFGVLIVPALLTLGFLVPASLAARKLPAPRATGDEPLLRDRPAFLRYAAGGALFAAGYVDFALIAFHFQRAHTVSAPMISVIFAWAMGVAAVAAPFFGRMLDRRGPVSVALAVTFTAIATALAFLAHGVLAGAGAALWGLGTVVQDSLLLAIVLTTISKRRASTSFGVYDLIFGVAWFAGSAVAGVLLDRSLLVLVAFSAALQFAAVPFFLKPAKTTASRA